VNRVYYIQSIPGSIQDVEFVRTAITRDRVKQRTGPTGAFQKVGNGARQKIEPSQRLLVWATG